LTDEPPLRWQVPPAAAGRRLDQHLAEHLDMPRHQAQRWIAAGRVRIDGRTLKAARKVVASEWIDCEPLLAPALDRPLDPEPGDLDVLHDDRDLVVVNKPAGLTVHPGAGRARGTLVHRLLARFPEIGAVGGPGRPGIVHRLDKDTTGVLLVARSELAYRRLSADFAARRVEKHYLAVVYGTPRAESGTIDRPIGRHASRRREMAVRPGGRPARTSYRRLAAAGGLSLLELDLHTGRTHQIRVHLKSAGWPLVGDPVYGEARWKSLPKTGQAALRAFPRPALHAWWVAIDHPSSGLRTRFTAPPPPDLGALWREVTAAAACPSPLCP
jgi:23S rRNA pseudouridine1911/1915/1917 synthase